VHDGGQAPLADDCCSYTILAVSGGYEATREAAMTAFDKSWRRE
jgi:hypothetical protein